MTLGLNRKLVSRTKLCLVSVFQDIVKDCPKMRNLPKISCTVFHSRGPATEKLLSPRCVLVCDTIQETASQAITLEISQ